MTEHELRTLLRRIENRTDPEAQALAVKIRNRISIKQLGIDDDGKRLLEILGGGATTAEYPLRTPMSAELGMNVRSPST